MITSPETIPYGRWAKAFRIRRGSWELVAPLEVGPRILRLGPIDGPNRIGTILGGGFGGSTLHLIEKSKEKEFLASFLREAEVDLGHTIEYFLTSPA